VVPNETLVTTTVLNHSYTNREVRMTLPVQVSYDSDVDRRSKLMEAAGAPNRGAEGTAERAGGLHRQFAESGIELELGVWINDPENGQGNLRSSINHTLWNSFRANGSGFRSAARIRIVLPTAAAAPGSSPPEPAPRR
jgi:small-conductance mechanosensitive channel